MPRIIYGPQQAILHFDCNESVADIQSVAHRRFSEGKGFFMTMAGNAADTGDAPITAHWFHPSIPLVFEYDVLDDTGAYRLPLELDQDKIDRCVGFCDEPLGMISGFTEVGPYLPFAPPPQSAE
jgi:hypothetical protein